MPFQPPQPIEVERVLQRLGFSREGLLRQRWVSKGEAKDIEIHGLLRDEWPARAKPLLGS